MSDSISPAIKQAARMAVRKAVREGILVPKTECEICGKPADKQQLDAHHHLGYADAHWLSVQWLCRADHARIHGGPISGAMTKQIHASRTPEERSAIARKALDTKRTRYTPEEMAAWSARRSPVGATKAGKLGGAAVNKLRVTCECGKTCAPGGMGQHLKATGHKLV